jgi:hypothetical protein
MEAGGGFNFSNDGRPAAAFVRVTAGDVAQHPQSCPAIWPGGSDPGWLQLGTNSSNAPVAVASGTPTDAGVVTVQCTVHAKGAGYDLTLSASLPGGASVQLGGTIDPGVANIGGTFYGINTPAPYAGGCTMTFTYGGNPVSAMPPLVAGAVWGHVSCQVTYDGTSHHLPGGNVATDICDIEADILFENCNP